ncbi:DUF58 domain-containing protein [Bifidobacterium felsineum]|uniref:DUF58 domain-containing protein n=1 Tax=Bifidobacterium felsineum TaxID=2045440 RepID=A0A2M9HJF6_9BIFI|nr:DUF58 domain-containing protein [Bifidobacterium felsineum]MBT1164295.1 DUF58 domain-containing protein [Bifidobacterium felsineum]PJM76948.1 DUF58 domain-containing protein [Bifidobacterium felsineum]
MTTPLVASSRLRRRAGRRLSRAAQHVRHAFSAYVSPWGWAIGIASMVCLALFPLLGWVELLVFGMMTAMMMFSAVILSLGNTRFEAHIGASQRRVTVGDCVNINVEISNTGKTATTNAHGDLPIGQAHERFTIPMLASGQSKHTELAFRTITRAVLPIGPLHIRKGDPFGFIRHEKQLAEQVTVFIHPKTVRLSALNAGIPRDLEGQPSGQIVDDDLDFYGLREYTPGDDVRNVHWLSSAKTGSLMIRQYEATRRTDTSLTLDINPDDYASAEEFEIAVSAHASIGVQCLVQNRPVYTHAGQSCNRPRNAMELLDEASGIVPNREDPPNLADSTLRHAPDASFYCFTVGSMKAIDLVKRMTKALPRSSRCVVLQVCSGANRVIRQFSNFTLATVGELDDLPIIMEALA